MLRNRGKTHNLILQQFSILHESTNPATLAPIIRRPAQYCLSIRLLTHVTVTLLRPTDRHLLHFQYPCIKKSHSQNIICTHGKLMIIPAIIILPRTSSGRTISQIYFSPTNSIKHQYHIPHTFYNQHNILNIKSTHIPSELSTHLTRSVISSSTRPSPKHFFRTGTERAQTQEDPHTMPPYLWFQC
jgi:hypothetical protein